MISVSVGTAGLLGIVAIYTVSKSDLILSPLTFEEVICKSIIDPKDSPSSVNVRWKVSVTSCATKVPVCPTS